MKLTKHFKINVIGVTLLELLLVTAIVGTIIFLSIGYVQQKALQMRMDRMVVQTQQLLNAGLAYYVDKGKWPSYEGAPENYGRDELEATGYISNITKNPFGNLYRVVVTAAPEKLRVWS